MNGGAFLVVAVIAQMPEGISVEHIIARVQLCLNSPRHASTIGQALEFGLGGFKFTKVRSWNGSVGESLCFGAGVVPEMASGNNPCAMVLVEGAVDLVEYSPVQLSFLPDIDIEIRHIVPPVAMPLRAPRFLLGVVQDSRHRIVSIGRSVVVDPFTQYQFYCIAQRLQLEQIEIGLALDMLDDGLQPLCLRTIEFPRDGQPLVGHFPKVGQQRGRDQLSKYGETVSIVFIHVLVSDFETHLYVLLRLIKMTYFFGQNGQSEF